MEYCVIVEFRGKQYFSIFYADSDTSAFWDWLSSDWWKYVAGIGEKTRNLLCKKMSEGELTSGALPAFPFVLRSWSIIPKVGFIWIDFVRLGEKDDKRCAALVCLFANQGISLRLHFSASKNPSDLIREWAEIYAPFYDKFEGKSHRIATQHEINHISKELHTLIDGGVFLGTNVWLTKFTINSLEAAIALIFLGERQVDCLCAAQTCKRKTRQGHGTRS
jgi:hypothetical protein